METLINKFREKLPESKIDLAIKVFNYNNLQLNTSNINMVCQYILTGN